MRNALLEAEGKRKELGLKLGESYEKIESSVDSPVEDPATLALESKEIVVPKQSTSSPRQWLIDQRKARSLRGRF